MIDLPEAAALETLDLLVIGGGIVGAGVARDAAMRGMVVRLVEQNDFASGTSSRSSRLLHGGLRYLGQGEVGLVREASREKQIVGAIAPHLCQPLPFLFPSYRGSEWPQWKLLVGVKAYDLLCGGKNFGPSTALARDELLGLLPGLALDGLRGGVRYFDALTNDSRLVLDSLRSAAQHGAVLNNYTEFRAAERRGDVWNATLVDRQTGAVTHARTRTIVNATGPWSDQIPNSQTALRLTKGVHLVTARSRLPLRDAVVMPEGSRILFAIPWGERVILGTTDTDYIGDREKPRCTDGDMQYVLDIVNRLFPGTALAPADVKATWAGLRPLVADANGKPSDISRRHEIAENQPGWFDVTGGKLTTYRLMAEETIDALSPRIGRRMGSCETAEVPLLSDPAAVQFSGILPPKFCEGAIAHFCHHEWARHLDDVLLRRAGWHYYLDNPQTVATQAAVWMAQVLGWTDEQRHAEINRYNTLVSDASPLSFTQQRSGKPGARSTVPSVSLPSSRHQSLLIAHRGASHDAPENTLAAFRLAWEQGADGIEADFHLTRDGHVVCIHDGNTLRTGGAEIDVADATLAELRQADVGTHRGDAWRGERIPTIEEVIETIPRGKKFFIELKCGPEIVAPLADVLERSPLSSEQIRVIGFRPDTLAACKKRLPNVRVHWLSCIGREETSKRWFPTAEEVVATLREIKADGFGGQNRPEHFDAPFVVALRQAGFAEFHAWWVEDAKSANFYQQLGALSLTTDQPQALRRLMASGPLPARAL